MAVLPVWFEISSMVVLLTILVLDLLFIIKCPHVPSMKEAAIWVGLYVTFGALFCWGNVPHR